MTHDQYTAELLARGWINPGGEPRKERLPIWVHPGAPRSFDWEGKDDDD